MKKILFCQGGLGDHLALSTIPEEWSKQGHEVFLSYRNIHRNLEIHELVWKLNPYISGYTDEEPVIYVSSDDGVILNKDRILNGWGFIESLEIKHGILNSGNVIPKIYRKHNHINELSEKTIINFQSITQHYKEDHVLQKLDQIIDNLGISESDILDVELIPDVNVYGNRFYNIHETKKIDTKYNKIQIFNIFNHCDVINSCKNYITLHSGSAVLASAINNKNTFVIMNDETKYAYDTRNFIFPNQNYIF